MKLIKPSYEIIKQEQGFEGLLKHIELCGRVCYKSEEKITEHSAKKFVEGLIKSGHLSVLEHGTVYLKVPVNIDVAGTYLDDMYSECKYVKVDTNPTNKESNWWAITTNYRVIINGNLVNDLQYLCEPTEYHEKRYTIRFTCDRGVSHEFVRHRVFSMSQESTRYCSYNKNKFNNEVSFILPTWLQEHHNFKDSVDINESAYSVLQVGSGDNANYQFLLSLQESEEKYLKLLKLGWKPQQARSVLPNALKTEIIMTGSASQWEHFFKLRDADAAHPQARELAEPLHKEFIKLGYAKDIIKE